ncbi:hypothetical protein TeGR_g6283 [Tetraparma gracilis]|uniref:Uncharacterized protein n=1 Tax=Tetraparma gracilis TaxID=2962635 RepID=A0ABQ6MI93_9STRA|nr:hypothetical protein TeGR_g6283 [Tetraparma gracilis]
MQPRRMTQSSSSPAVEKQLLAPYMVNYLSGVIGGIAVTLASHPFDTVKVRLQTQPVKSTLYTGSIQCAHKIFRKEGFFNGLYAGVASPLFGQMFFRACGFMTFHEVSEALNPGEGASKADVYSRLVVAGAITGAIITGVETPIDLVKTKLQTTHVKLIYDPR